ncbi:MAG: hypothetical protein ACTHU5_06000, partial [Psychrobacter sp.]
IYLIFITIFKMRTHPRLNNLKEPTYYDDSTLAFLLSEDISIILVLGRVEHSNVVLAATIFQTICTEIFDA